MSNPIKAIQADAQVKMTEEDGVKLLASIVEMARTGAMQSIEPLLPAYLAIRNKPYTLNKHFVMAPLFRARLPSQLLLMAGRQISKSMSCAADGILRANMLPGFRTLFVTPRFEQIRRFSTNYVQHLLINSPAAALWTGSNIVNSVLQKDFRNNSQLMFSYALLNADRCRGISADRVNFDEIQDMNEDHLPIIVEAMASSDWRITQYGGTPKTYDNTIHKLWQESSQAEWFVPCFNCKPTRWNIPSLDHHLDAMIGEHSYDIGPDRPGTVCYHCAKPIDPRHGRWKHRFNDRRESFAGYHIPQIIMPHHYADPYAWLNLINKRNSMASSVFYNEVLGVSYDSGTKLVNESDLRAAATLPWTNNIKSPDPQVMAAIASGAYIDIVLGVDWGGGGKLGVSYTSLALCGLLPDGSIECIWGKRLMTPHDHLAEAAEIMSWMRKFGRIGSLAHDYTGAGTLRETLLSQAGLGETYNMPITYIRSAAAGLLTFIPSTHQHPRAHYQLDKTRAILYVCQAIKLQKIRFFKYDYVSKDYTGLISDFLALVDEKRDTMSALQPYMIGRQLNKSDDFAQAVTMASCSLWYRANMWPDLAGWAGLEKHVALTYLQQEAAVGGTWDAPPLAVSEFFGDGF